MRPEWRDGIRTRLAQLHLAPEREAEIVDELAQHLDDRYREMRAAGQDDAAAMAAAWRELDEEGVMARELTKSERSRLAELPPPGAPARGRWLSTLAQDVRYSMRSLRQQPTFAATVLLALALAIGPATAIVSIGNWLLWRPVASVADPGKLAVVQFARKTGPNSTTGWSLSYPNRRDLKARMTKAHGLAGVQEVSAGLIVQGQAPRMVEIGEITDGFFEVLGMRPAAGRTFLPEEDLGPVGAPVAIVSHDLARDVFGSAQAAIDQRVLLNKQPFRIVGVAAPGFRGVTTLSRCNVWITAATMPYLGGVPSADWAVGRANGIFNTNITRIASGATAAEVAAELTGLAAALVEAFPAENNAGRGAAATVLPGLSVPPNMRTPMQAMVNVLLAIGGVLLLLGCANAANMLIARTIRREHEIAVRKALGASRARLVQVQLTESCLLALGGAASGLGLAFLLKEVIQGLLFPAAPGLIEPVPLDLRVMTMTTVIALAVGVTAGLAPAWMVARGRVSAAIARTGVSRTASRVPRLRSTLAVAQLGLSLALLIGALLLVATLRNLRGVDLGFDPTNVTTLNVNFDDNGYTPERAVAYQRELLAALGASGPESSVTIAQRAPFSSSSIIRVLPPGAVAGQTMRVWSNGVAHNYFAVLRTPIVHGRAFTLEEAFATAPVDQAPAIINETLARQLFGHTDVVGRTIDLAAISRRPVSRLPIVGVARDAHWVNVDGTPEPFLYQPLGRYDFGATRSTVIVRSARPPRVVGDEVRAAAARLDGLLPLSPAFPLTAAIDRDIREQRLFAGVLSWLGALAIVLAAVGLHGLIAQTTIERTREFGIRLAIGASRVEIVRLIARYIAVVLAFGTAIGIALAVTGIRFVESVLFGVKPLDPATYALAVGMLALAVVVAAAWPAWRATRVQPVEVLRAE